MALNNVESWTVGYGAGHYCNATAKPWSNHFNMETYVTKELPNLVNSYFPVDPSCKSITGHSMGGAACLAIGMNHAKEYKSVAALAPVCNYESGFSEQALKIYHGESPDWRQKAEKVSPVHLVKARSAEGMRPKDIIPPTLISLGTADQWGDILLRTNEFMVAVREAKLN